MGGSVTKSELFKKSELFDGLKPSELETLAGKSEYRRFKQGSTVIRDASFAGHVYVVDAGDVVISRKNSRGEDTVLARYLDGEYFGELDLFNNEGSVVSIRTEADTGLLIFPAAGKDAIPIFAEHPEIASKILKNLLSVVARRIRSTNQLLSERSPWVQELRRRVFVDKLTGLYNRTWLNEELDKELQSRKSGCAALIIKPDNFKEINDTYGHDAGDKTLALLGSAVQHIAADKAIPARHGGDVFAIIFKNANIRQIRSFSRSAIQYLRNLELSDIIDADDFRITASVGVAVRDRGCRVPMSDIIQRAFDRMLLARESGGNKICDTEDVEDVLG